VFSEAKDDGSGGVNWNYKLCKAPVKSSPTNQHPVFYRPDALPVAHPTVVAMPLVSPLMPVPQRIEALQLLFTTKYPRAQLIVYRSLNTRSSSFTTLRQITSPRAVVFLMWISASRRYQSNLEKATTATIVYAVSK